MKHFKDQQNHTHVKRVIARTRKTPAIEADNREFKNTYKKQLWMNFSAGLNLAEQNDTKHAHRQPETNRNAARLESAAEQIFIYQRIPTETNGNHKYHTLIFQMLQYFRATIGACWRPFKRPFESF